MAGEIKQTIKLAGEKEYSAALKAAQRNLRTLRSELKAETAELGANATAQQKNEARAKSLQKQIAEQEKVVETLKKALAEAKRDYSDNEDVVQKWEQKLNEARATLADMQNGLSETENAMRGASDATAEGVVATKSFADAIANVASVGDSASSTIEGIFTGLIDSVRDVVTDLWDMIGETAAKANNWTDIAGYWNTSPENVEKWARAVEASHNSFADFETVVTRLNLGGKGKEIAEMLGVSDVNYEDQWAYAVAAMERISELTKAGNMPENFWETVFGEKKATKAMDLVNDWDAIKANLTTFDADNGGFGMGAGMLAQMSDLMVQIDEVEQKWEALKDEAAGKMGVIEADLLINVSGGLDAINAYFNAQTEAEREQAIEEIEKNVTEAFEKVAKAIEEGLAILERVGGDLQKSDDPIVKAVGSILSGITETLQWLVNNADAVKAALESVFGVWFVAKLTVIAGKLAAIIAQIETIKAFKGLSDIGSVATGAGASAAGGVGAASGAATAALPWAAIAAGTAAVWFGGNAAAYESEWGDYNRNTGFERREELLTQTGDETIGKLQELYRTMSEAVDMQESLGIGEDLTEPIKEAFRQYANEFLEFDPDNAFWGWAEQLADMSDGLDVDEIENIIEGVFDGDAWMSFGADAVNAVSDKIDQLMGPEAYIGQTSLATDDLNSNIKGLPGLLRQALFTKVGDLKVVINEEVVARILTPLVSQNIARDIT